MEVFWLNNKDKIRRRAGLPETFAECSILFKFKEGENFNHRNILDISRIKI